jgi:outer membrane autotransporter protein
MFGPDTLTLRARAAWVHDFNTDRRINAVLQTVPGASFTVNGAPPSADAALLTVGLEVAMPSGWKLGGKFDREFGSRSQSYAGAGTLRYSW